MFEFHVDFHSLLNDDGTPRAPHVTLIVALRKIDRHAAQRRALGFYLKGHSERVKPSYTAHLNNLHLILTQLTFFLGGGEGGGGWWVD